MWQLEQMMGGKKGGGKGAMLMAMMKMMADGGMGGQKRKGGGGFELPAGKKAKMDDKTWKMRLNEALSKKTKEPVTKDTITYQTEPSGTGFISVIVSDKFEDSHSGEGDSKKAAEDAAAKAAFKTEFPEEWKKLSAGAKNAKPGAKPKQQHVEDDEGASVGPGGKLTTMVEIPWCSRLQGVVGKTLKVNLVKDDIKYSFEKVEGTQSYRATVTSKHFKSEHTGGKRGSKSAAKESAAKVAFSHEFGSIFAQLPPEVRGADSKDINASKDGPAAGPKQELFLALFAVNGKNPTKEEMAVKFEESAGKLVPTLKISFAKGKAQTIKGEPIAADASKADKKAAETAVVKKALDANKAVFKKKVAELQAKAEEKKAQQKVAFKAIIEKKKAEKKGKAGGL